MMSEEYIENLTGDSWRLIIALLYGMRQGTWTTKETVCNMFPQSFKINTNEKSHDVCVRINTCKNFINDNVEIFGYIVITNKDGDLKIPSTEEANQYLNHELKLILRRMKRYWNKTKALGIKNQNTFDDGTIRVCIRENEDEN